MKSFLEKGGSFFRFRTILRGNLGCLCFHPFPVQQVHGYILPVYKVQSHRI